MNRHLAIPQFVPPCFEENLRCMGHTIFRQFNFLQCLPVKGPETIMCIAQQHAGKQEIDEPCQLQNHLFEKLRSASLPARNLDPSTISASCLSIGATRAAISCTSCCPSASKVTSISAFNFLHVRSRFARRHPAPGLSYAAIRLPADH